MFSVNLSISFSPPSVSYLGLSIGAIDKWCLLSNSTLETTSPELRYYSWVNCIPVLLHRSLSSRVSAIVGQDRKSTSNSNSTDFMLVDRLLSFCLGSRSNRKAGDNDGKGRWCRWRWQRKRDKTKIRKKRKLHFCQRQKRRWAKLKWADRERNTYW